MTESPSYKKNSVDLLCKSIDWFSYDMDRRGERVKTAGDFI